MTHRLFFLEDEDQRYREYVEWLRDEGFDVVFFAEIDGAMSWLQKHAASISCFIIDCLLPYGDSFSAHETENGLFAGLAVYRHLRQSGITEAPIILLTNSNDPRIRADLADDPRGQVLQKSQVLIDELAQIVRELIEEAGIGPEPERTRP